MLKKEIGALSKIFFKRKLKEENENTFRNTFNLYIKEDYDEFIEYFPEFNENELKLYMRSFSLELGNYPQFDNNFLVIRNWVYYKEKQIGEYILYLNLNGSYEDDVFVLF